MADINVLDLTPTTPGSNDSLILFDRTTGEGKSTRFDTLTSQVLDSKFGDSNPTAGQELSYDAATGKYKNTSRIASLNEALTNKTNDIISTMSANGAHNLLPNTLKSQVQKGVTYTVNSDGSIYANGTATADSIAHVGNITLDVGTYILTGAISENMRLILASDGQPNKFDEGSGLTFTVDSKTSFDVHIYIKNGFTVNDTFYPMIRCSSDKDQTYTPYAMTNRELSEYDSDFISFTPTSDMTVIESYSRRVGKVVTIYGNVSFSTAGTHVVGSLLRNIPSTWIYSTAMCEGDTSRLLGIRPSHGNITVYRAPVGSCFFSFIYIVD